MLMAIGIGLSINNSRAVVEGLAGHQSEFRHALVQIVVRAGGHYACVFHETDPIEALDGR